MNAIDQLKLYTKESYSNSIIHQMNALIKEYAIYMRETIFEEVRLKQYQELPSRRSCIYVCEKKSLNYWYDKLPGDKRIFRIRLNGNIHKANENYLATEYLPGEEIYKNAYNYWEGSKESNSICEEILFEGDITILEEIPKENIIR